MHVQLLSLDALIEDEAVNDSDIINNLIDYGGQEEPDSMTTDKIYAEIQLYNKLEKHFLKTYQFQKEFEIPKRASIIHIWLSKQPTVVAKTYH
ncbi:hypothetical protein TNCV_3016771 [Trichonephila clavipes]|nr:hypothetical protein TNCV_3016771 [Trichonephila clavipes]